MAARLSPAWCCRRKRDRPDGEYGRAEMVREVAAKTSDAAGDGTTTGTVWNSKRRKPASRKFKDLIPAGVIDPAKVTRWGVANASSIAGLRLTTEVLVSEASVHPYRNLKNKINKGPAAAIKTSTWNQLNSRRPQFEHLIFQSGSTVPQWEQDQMILGIDTP